MPTDFGLANRVARDVDLHSVTLCSAELISHVDPLNPPTELRIEQRHRPRYEIRESTPDHVHVFIDFEFEAADASDESHSETELFSLEATYLLTYALPGAFTRDTHHLQYFAQLNGSYNVWPYWRELVQTVTGRVGLASFVVPVLKLTPSDVPEEAPTTTASAPEGARRRRPARKAAGEKRTSSS